jgi:hypothetical protein
MIRFSCPGCGATYSVEDAKGGKTGKCPKCQSQFVIPMPEGGAAPPPLPKSPSPPADPNAPVEIAPCPKCDARLSVAASDIGVDVECPYCKTVYKAVKPGSGAAAKPKSRASRGDEEEERPSRRRREEDEEEEDRPRPRRRRDEDEEEEERPSRRGRRDEDDEDEERPSRRRDDEDEEDRPRKKKKKKRRGRPGDVPNYLVQAILVTLCCCLPGGIAAIVYASKVNSLLDQGDYEGAVEASENAKKWCMISLVAGIIGNVVVGVLQFIAGAGGK